MTIILFCIGFILLGIGYEVSNVAKQLKCQNELIIAYLNSLPEENGQ